MANWKTFTPEELKLIRENPYVKSATSKMIRFTAEFKEEFWRQYSEEHKSPQQIMKDLGFDVEVLGANRINGILIHIREQARSGEGCWDVRKVYSDNERPLPPSKAILKLQHELEYLKQEVEFIKKNILLDREAKRKR